MWGNLDANAFSIPLLIPAFFLFLSKPPEINLPKICHEIVSAQNLQQCATCAATNLFHRNGQSMEDCCCDVRGAVYDVGRR